MAAIKAINHTIDKTEDTFKFNDSEGKKEINVNIDCYYKNTAGVDEMADQIETAIKANSIDGINLTSLSSAWAEPLTPNETKFHIKTVTATYDRE